MTTPPDEAKPEELRLADCPICNNCGDWGGRCFNEDSPNYLAETDWYATCPAWNEAA